MFKGRIVIITGGSSGVGRELALRLRRRGALLVLLARSEERLHAARVEVETEASAGAKVETFSCDITDWDALLKTMGSIAETVGLPDILINSAGILSEGYFEKVPLTTFREVMDTNFFGTLHCIRAVLPYFQEKGGGRIVNISSMAGLVGCFGYSAYCASKHAVTGLTHTLRTELGPQKVKLHLVCPPEFDSPMVDALNTYRTPENRAMVHLLPVMQAGPVAEAIIRGIEREQYEIIPGLPSRLARLAQRLFPSLTAALQDHRLSRIYRGPGSSC